MKKIIKRLLKAIVYVCVAAAIVVFSLNACVIYGGKGRIITPESAEKLSDVDCIIVLGCGLNADNTPSPMLTDRLSRGIELYKDGVSDNLLMSGDHATEYHDEVNTMKTYAEQNGVESSDIFMDHAGFSTYESMYRAKNVFGAERVVVVTQPYHLYRALYVAKALGLDAYGVAADYTPYRGQLYREAREILARDKDFFLSLAKPNPVTSKEKFSLTGDGNVTNDK